jgi:hypothetical protein
LLLRRCHLRPGKIKLLMQGVVKSVSLILFHPIRTLAHLRSMRHFGFLNPWALENIVFPAPLSVAFLLKLMHNFRIEAAGLLMTAIFTALSWGAPRLAAAAIARFCGERYAAVETEQVYLFFLGSLPAYYFSIDSHASWIAVDILVDGLRALRYDPPTVTVVAAFSLLLVPAIQLKWCHVIRRPILAALPGVVILAVATFCLIEFFWGLADAMQNP